MSIQNTNKTPPQIIIRGGRVFFTMSLNLTFKLAGIFYFDQKIVSYNIFV